MSIKKIFSLALLVWLGAGVFYAPLVLAEEKIGQACVDAAGEELKKCYGQKGADGSTLQLCDDAFAAAIAKCQGLYSPASIGGLINPLFGKSVPGLVGQIISAVLGVVGSIALILFIYAGFQWMMARGNPEQVKSATQTMIWAALGIAIIFSSYLILNFIFQALSKK